MLSRPALSDYEKLKSEDFVPAVLVRDPAILDAGEGLIELHGQGADALAVTESNGAIAIGELADRRDDGGGAGAPHFLQRSILRGGKNLVDACLLYTSDAADE